MAVSTCASSCGTWSRAKISAARRWRWSTADLRLAAHRIADAVYEKLTGDKGVFSTRIAYVTRVANRYTLRVTDADGEGGQVALNSTRADHLAGLVARRQIVGLRVVRKRQGRGVVQDVATGERRAIANFRGSNSAPAWSPDGRTLAVTLSRDGGSQIYLMDRRAAATSRRVTQSSAIDTEPVFTPDGKPHLFCQRPRRQPADLPRGRGRRQSGAGDLHRQLQHQPRAEPRWTHARLRCAPTATSSKSRPWTSAGGTVRTLSDTADDESPSFAPNGKLHHLRHARAGARCADDHHARWPHPHATVVVGHRCARADLGTFRPVIDRRFECRSWNHDERFESQ